MGSKIEHMISNRQEKLLDFVVREYVRTAKPVGSALAANKGHLHFSPATIRNEMNDLEQQGFLVQLHTSGGRVQRINPPGIGADKDAPGDDGRLRRGG